MRAVVYTVVISMERGRHGGGGGGGGWHLGVFPAFRGGHTGGFIQKGSLRVPGGDVWGRMDIVIQSGIFLGGGFAFCEKSFLIFGTKTIKGGFSRFACFDSALSLLFISNRKCI